MAFLQVVRAIHTATARIVQLKQAACLDTILVWSAWYHGLDSVSCHRPTWVKIVGQPILVISI
jgi:hypothetical protein